MKKTKQIGEKKIKHLILDNQFYNGKFEYILGDGVRLDLVKTVMKINEIINYINYENKTK